MSIKNIIQKNKILSIVVGVSILVIVISLLLPEKESPGNMPSGGVLTQLGLLPTPTLKPAQIVIEEPAKKYQIVYTEYNQTYILSILDSDFEKYRQEAEKALLEQLKINQSQACKLTVIISSPHFINPGNPPPYFNSLSFCPTPTPIKDSKISAP